MYSLAVELTLLTVLFSAHSLACKVGSLLTTIRCEQCFYQYCIHTLGWEGVISMWSHRSHSKFVKINIIYIYIYLHEFHGNVGLPSKKNLTWLQRDMTSGWTHSLQERPRLKLQVSEWEKGGGFVWTLLTPTTIPPFCMGLHLVHI